MGRVDVDLSFQGAKPLRYRVRAGLGGTKEGREERTVMGWVPGPTAARAAADSCLEVSIPLAELRRGAGGRIDFRVLILEGDVESECHPEAGPLEIVPEEVTRG